MKGVKNHETEIVFLYFSRIFLQKGNNECYASITILQFHEFLPLQIVSDDDVHHYMYVNVCMQTPLYQMNATRPCDVYRGRSSTLQYIVAAFMNTRLSAPTTRRLRGRNLLPNKSKQGASVSYILRRCRRQRPFFPLTR